MPPEFIAPRRFERHGGRPKKQALQQSCTSLATEHRVARLIAETNRRHRDTAVTTWVYELTTEIHNIGIVVGETSRTLLVNPSWLRFVIEAGDFKACVADEITAWYLIEALTTST
jgi:hypothetical protein